MHDIRVTDDLLKSIRNLLWLILAAVLALVGFSSRGLADGELHGAIAVTCLFASLGIPLVLAVTGICRWISRKLKKMEEEERKLGEKPRNPEGW